MQLPHGRLQLAWRSHLGLQQRLDGARVWWLLAGIAEPPRAVQIRLHLGQEKPGLGERIQIPDAGELSRAGLPALHRAGDVGVEQLGHMPSEDERRDDAVSGSISGAAGRRSSLRL
jgi:hypothetical protein